MTLREKISDLILHNCDAVEVDEIWGTLKAADAILAAIRAHMTSPEAVERGGAAIATLNHWPKTTGCTGFEREAQAAILAALDAG